MVKITKIFYIFQPRKAAEANHETQSSQEEVQRCWSDNECRRNAKNNYRGFRGSGAGNQLKTNCGTKLHKNDR